MSNENKVKNENEIPLEISLIYQEMDRLAVYRADLYDRLNAVLRSEFPEEEACDSEVDRASEIGKQLQTIRRSLQAENYSLRDILERLVL